METHKTWGDVFKDPIFLISLFVVTQFFSLVILFGFWKSTMQDQAKMVILQTYTAAFIAIVAFWLGRAVAKNGTMLTGKQDQKPAEEPKP